MTARSWAATAPTVQAGTATVLFIQADDTGSDLRVTLITSLAAAGRDAAESRRCWREPFCGPLWAGWSTGSDFGSSSTQLDISAHQRVDSGEMTDILAVKTADGSRQLGLRCQGCSLCR